MGNVDYGEVSITSAPIGFHWCTHQKQTIAELALTSNPKPKSERTVFVTRKIMYTFRGQITIRTRLTVICTLTWTTSFLWKLHRRLSLHRNPFHQYYRQYEVTWQVFRKAGLGQTFYCVCCYLINSPNSCGIIYYDLKYPYLITDFLLYFITNLSLL